MDEQPTVTVVSTETASGVTITDDRDDKAHHRRGR
jgi:hypothetical protein